MESPVPLKPLYIRPEGLWDQILEFVGFDDINFESAEFSRRFYVKGPDKRWAYDVLHPRTMEFLLGMPSFHVQFDEGHVMVWGTKRLDPWGDLELAVEVGVGLLERLPEYLVRQQEGKP